MTVITNKKVVETEERKHYCDVCGKYLGKELEDGYYENDANFNATVETDSKCFVFSAEDVYLDLCEDCNDLMYNFFKDLIKEYFNYTDEGKEKLINKIKEIKNNKNSKIRKTIEEAEKRYDRFKREEKINRHAYDNKLWYDSSYK